MPERRNETLGSCNNRCHGDLLLEQELDGSQKSIVDERSVSWRRWNRVFSFIGSFKRAARLGWGELGTVSSDNGASFSVWEEASSSSRPDRTTVFFVDFPFPLELPQFLEQFLTLSHFNPVFPDLPKLHLMSGQMPWFGTCNTSLRKLLFSTALLPRIRMTQKGFPPIKLEHLEASESFFVEEFHINLSGRSTVAFFKVVFEASLCFWTIKKFHPHHSRLESLREVGDVFGREGDGFIDERWKGNGKEIDVREGVIRKEWTL
ncbi:uncharacterized protein G2W53_029021 [Senna tora]|uniref:Uncharacterized protein n=1 Tax=Senna tora TaxID=362788 RepID=A0A834T4G0_9FABA|nr:uncharacterized protein G2W53_029021 [Senna tora]